MSEIGRRWFQRTLSACLAAPAAVAAQYDAPPPPAAYAFENVRVVSADGSSMDSVNLVVRLARRDIPVILTMEAAFRPTPDRDDSITASYRNAALLTRAGVTVGFASDQGGGGDGQARNLPYVAAWSVAFGLPEEEAVRAITLNNARILGMGDTMGSLDPGKRADIIVADGSPLQHLTTIEHMFVGGLEVDPMDNRHTRLYEQFRTRR